MPGTFRLPRFTNRLAFRIAAPLALAGAVFSVGLYFVVISAVQDFARSNITDNMEWLARDVFSICSQSLDELLQEGGLGDPRRARVVQVRTLMDIEDFLREFGARGIVWTEGQAGERVLLAPETQFDVNQAIRATTKPHTATRLELAGSPVYAYSIRFHPWNWNVLILKEADEYASLQTRVRRTTIVTLGLVLAGILLTFLVVHQVVNRPLQAVVSQIKKGDKPEYQGTHEIEFLAESVHAMMASLEDLTRNLETLVTQRTRDLEAKAGELEEANLRLTELDRLKSAFLSSVSHELRTPLTSVLGFAKLIRKDFARIAPQLDKTDASPRFASRIDENLEIIVTESQRLTRLINDVLDLSSIESGNMNWRDRFNNPGDLVRRAVKAVEPTYEARPEVELKSRIPGDLPSLWADPDRIHQVLVNLLDNAAKFTDHGEVTVEVGATQAGYVRFCVRDTGRGILADGLNRIFDKFYQAMGGDTLEDKPFGTGLGLAICKQIVEHYGGTIKVDSVPGSGTEFVFELPSAPDAVKVPASLEADPAPAPGPDPVPANDPLPRTVLVVEDDFATSAYLGQVLEGEGHRVVTAADGTEAVAAARAVRPDLVTMDLMLPGMNGRHAIQAIKSIPELHGIPILVVSALAEREDTGADAALAKPLDEGLLLDTVRGLLRDAPARGAVLAVENEAGTSTPVCFLCQGPVSCCTPSELWHRLEHGFRGTILFCDSGDGDPDLARLVARPGVQVVMVATGRDDS
jgi:signal transduction histidine kinase/CheY-like chemotaxis protein